ncbi:D-beta-hydroxybutyrate dehydrogenase-like protein, partial [Dinothrombium tinctorium]
SIVICAWISWQLVTYLRRILPRKTVKTKGKAVVITGCDSGFGHMLALSLVKRGFTVYACCLQPESEDAKLLFNKSGFSPNMQIVSLDVTDETSVKQAFDSIFFAICIRNEKLWALVNNAGIIQSSEVEWGSFETFLKIFDVNVFGMVRVTRQFLSVIRLHKARIINMGSVSSHFTAPTLTAYSMSKYAVAAFSNGLRREMEKWNVDVIEIQPDTYRTPMTKITAMVEGLEKNWQSTDIEIQKQYGVEYFVATKAYLHSNLSKARKYPEEVISAFENVILSPKVYHLSLLVCGWHNRLIIWLFDTLPPQWIEP